MDSDEENDFVRLKETYSLLCKEKLKILKTIERLTKILKNNEIKPVSEVNTRESIGKARLKFVEALRSQVEKKQPLHLPTLETDDIYNVIIKNLQTKSASLKDQIEITKKRQTEDKDEIKDLETTLTVLRDMKNAYLEGRNNEAAETFEPEIKIARKIFSDTKYDLAALTELIFPDNANFRDLFTALTKNLLSDGDEYIEFDPKYIQEISFLDKADLITFHPYNKNKIKIMDLL